MSVSIYVFPSVQKNISVLPKWRLTRARYLGELGFGPVLNLLSELSFESTTSWNFVIPHLVIELQAQKL